MHAVIQVPPDGVVGSHNCRCHLFAACIVDVTVCFSSQTVSALTSGLLRYSAHPADCIFSILVRKVVVGKFPATAIPNSRLCFHGIFLVTQILPRHKPSCILYQHEVCHPCAVERLVGASPFFLLLDTSLFETVIIHPCTMPQSSDHSRVTVVAYIDSSSLFADSFSRSCHTIPVPAHVLFY